MWRVDIANSSFPMKTKEQISSEVRIMRKMCVCCCFKRILIEMPTLSWNLLLTIKSSQSYDMKTDKNANEKSSNVVRWCYFCLFSLLFFWNIHLNLGVKQHCLDFLTFGMRTKATSELVLDNQNWILTLPVSLFFFSLIFELVVLRLQCERSIWLHVQKWR